MKMKNLSEMEARKQSLKEAHRKVPKSLEKKIKELKNQEALAKPETLPKPESQETAKVAEASQQTTSPSLDSKPEATDIKMQVQDIPITVQPVNEPAASATGKNGEISELQLAMNGLMLRTTIMGLNKLLVGFTGIEKMAFDEDETAQLVALWSPFIPQVSPLVTAIAGTVIIVGGKVGILVIEKRKQNKMKGETNVQSKPAGIPNSEK